MSGPHTEDGLRPEGADVSKLETMAMLSHAWKAYKAHTKDDLTGRCLCCSESFPCKERLLSGHLLFFAGEVDADASPMVEEAPANSGRSVAGEAS